MTRSCSSASSLASGARGQAQTALRALYATYPTAARSQSDDEVFEIITARILAELCDDLLVALEDHRSHVSSRLKRLRHPDQTAWPF